MRNLVRATISAAATAAALLLAQPAQAALVQPHRTVSDIGKSANILDAVRYRGGSWGNRGGYWRRGGWAYRAHSRICGCTYGSPGCAPFPGWWRPGGPHWGW